MRSATGVSALRGVTGVTHLVRSQTRPTQYHHDREMTVSRLHGTAEPVGFGGNNDGTSAPYHGAYRRKENEVSYVEQAIYDELVNQYEIMRRHDEAHASQHTAWGGVVAPLGTHPPAFNDAAVSILWIFFIKRWQRFM